MAMIELTDLGAPFKKWTHVVSMILAITLFAAFRLTGGGVSLTLLSSSQTPVSSRSAPETLTASSFIADEEESEDSRSLSKRTLGATAPADDFDPLSITKGRGAEEEDELVDAFGGISSKNGKKNGFADIERELGLR